MKSQEVWPRRNHKWARNKYAHSNQYTLSFPRAHVYYDLTFPFLKPLGGTCHCICNCILAIQWLSTSSKLLELVTKVEHEHFIDVLKDVALVCLQHSEACLVNRIHFILLLSRAIVLWDYFCNRLLLPHQIDISRMHFQMFHLRKNYQRLLPSTLFSVLTWNLLRQDLIRNKAYNFVFSFSFRFICFPEDLWIKR